MREKKPVPMSTILRNKEARLQSRILMAPCEGCIHAVSVAKSKGLNGRTYELKCCNYILDTGRKRPCPPGKDCTVKEIGDRKKMVPFDAIM